MPEVTELAGSIASAMPAMSAEEQRLALALYRRLAEGEPVRAEDLAADTGGDEKEIEQTLGRWPGTYRGDDGRIVGFWGLALPETAHRFRVDGRLLHTWCAWDALFIPALIGRTAEVESSSPVSGHRVQLTVAPEGVVGVEPGTTVVSMLDPRKPFDDGVVTSFCHFVHFFPDAADAEPWLAEQEGVFLLSLDDAFELGRLTNRRLYGDALSAAG